VKATVRAMKKKKVVGPDGVHSPLPPPKKAASNQKKFRKLRSVIIVKYSPGVNITAMRNANNPT